MRHQSLPRRLLGNLVSERNLNEEVEQSFLKQFLKEHGLYNKHQTVQQRRRLKYLLELEQRTTMQVAKGQKDVSVVPSDTDRGICSIELHSMPFLEPNTSPKLLCNSFASSLPRTSSLSALKSVTDTDFHFDEACTSLPSFTHQAKDVVNSKGLKTVSWETSESFLETEF
uniref:Uncharacterized protein n=1 Tax=Anopheles funestus TaxID=62324 RepID=A0A4Y0BN69_ANOFN